MKQQGEEEENKGKKKGPRAWRRAHSRLGCTSRVHADVNREVMHDYNIIFQSSTILFFLFLFLVVQTILRLFFGRSVGVFRFCFRFQKEWWRWGPLLTRGKNKKMTLLKKEKKKKLLGGWKLIAFHFPNGVLRVTQLWEEIAHALVPPLCI